MSNPISLVINRDSNGAASGSLFLGDGVSQSGINNGSYEYYNFKFGNKALKKQIGNEMRMDHSKELKEIIITNAEDLKDTDFACMTTESYSVVQLSHEYKEATKSLVLTDTGSIPLGLFDLKDVHFGKKDSDVNLCNIDSHFYKVDSI